uniref:Ycf54 n=1 Tax=Synura petersenii TaxID=52555 RepID=A0A3G2QYU3_9STRA|nr:Ycf54 [Synura petersenii]
MNLNSNQISSPLFYIILSQYDVLKNNVIEELLRERTEYYKSQNKVLDFWVFLNPTFLDVPFINLSITSSEFYLNLYNQINFDNKNYLAVVVSTNKDYINWLKLRLGGFNIISIENSLKNPLKKIRKSSIKWDGLYGRFNSLKKIDNNTKNLKKPYLFYLINFLNSKNVINPLLNLEIIKLLFSKKYGNSYNENFKNDLLKIEEIFIKIPFLTVENLLEKSISYEKVKIALGNNIDFKNYKINKWLNK